MYMKVADRLIPIARQEKAQGRRRARWLIKR